jgi:hypothetical protein
MKRSWHKQYPPAIFCDKVGTSSILKQFFVTKLAQAVSPSNFLWQSWHKQYHQAFFCDKVGTSSILKHFCDKVGTSSILKHFL